MDITQHPGADFLELRLNGRLDATWADHVSGTIETAVRGGSHQIVLNFAGVDYISSLGIRVLLMHWKQLKAVNGRLSICEPSAQTLEVLISTGLARFLLVATDAVASAPATVTTLTRAGTRYQIFPQPVASPLAWDVVGRPEQLGTGGFAETDCRALVFKNGAFGLGLGGFGAGFPDCKDRFGEFLAAGGCVVTLPTNDRHALPDYVVEEGTLVPSVQTLYAITGSGDFSSMIRFDAEGGGTLGLSALVGALVEFSGESSASGATAATPATGATAFVVLAEAASLVGATLRQSPATRPASLQLPALRDWLSFTTEPSTERSLALIVGVAAKKVPTGAEAFLRPMQTDAAVHAHIHAAVFPYRPVQRGELPFGKTIADLMAASTPGGVLHLMADTRPFEGVGETELVRGACWVGALPALSRS